MKGWHGYIRLFVNCIKKNKSTAGILPNIQMLNHKIIKSESTFGRRSSSAQCEALSDDGLFTPFTPYPHPVQEGDVKAAKSPPPPPPQSILAMW